MRLLPFILIFLACFPGWSEEDQGNNNNLTAYRGMQDRMDKRSEGKMAGLSDMYKDAVKEYSNAMYNKARDDAKKGYKTVFADIRKTWNGPPTDKRVPDSVVKKFLENRISEKSLDTMILALSGVNAIDDCELVKLAPLGKSKLSKFAPPGLKGEAYEKVNGIGKVSNGYVEPHSHHFYKLASAIYVLGILSYQNQYDEKVDYLRAIKNEGSESFQEEMLEVSIELNMAARYYVAKQIELKKLYKEMISSAAKMAGDETNSKATRVSYRNSRREKAAKDYKKKKKRAHLSDHAARDAVKAYEVHRIRKYEHQMSQVHTHIGCGEVQAVGTTYNKSFLDIIFPAAFAEETVSPLFDYYRRVSKETNQSTNDSMKNPESRLMFLTKNSVDVIDNDISEIEPNLSEYDSNIEKLQGVYTKFTQDQGESLNEGDDSKKVSRSLTPGMDGFKGMSANIAQAGTDETNAAFGSFDAGSAELGTSGSLKNAFLNLKKAGDKIKKTDFKGSKKGDKKESFLEMAKSLSMDELKKLALKDLSDDQRKALEAAFQGKFGTAPTVETSEEEDEDDKKKKVAIAANTKKGKNLNLPDIDDDPALKLLKKKPKIEKLKKDEDVDPVNAESLQALQEGATDINNDRETTLWVIISNRYVRTGFSRLMEKK